MKVLEPQFVPRPAQVGLIVLRLVLGRLGSTRRRRPNGNSWPRRLADPVFAERIYIILSLTAKTSLAWQGYGGALAGR